MVSSQGSNASKNGADYEELSKRIMFRKIGKNYTIRNEELNKSKTNIVYREFWDNGKEYCIYSEQEGFVNNFLPKYNIYINNESTKEPDGFFYYPDKNLAIILEIKKQGTKGSVKEKIANGPFLRDYQYKRLLSKLNCKIEIVYVLDEWFRENLEQDYYDNMDDHNILYHFGVDFPLELIGLEERIKTSPEEIKRIEEDMVRNYDEPLFDLF